MAATERTHSGSVGSAAVTIVAIVILLLIGFSFWPRIKAAYYAAPIQVQQPAQPTADTSALKAQLESVKAQLQDARARMIVQDVPAGQAPQTVTTPNESASNVSAPPAAEGDPTAEPLAPHPMIIVLHQDDTHGAPIVTGSGACAVAAKGARRCGN